jgi:hypothetical protein
MRETSAQKKRLHANMAPPGYPPAQAGILPTDNILASYDFKLLEFDHSSLQAR